MTHSICTIKSRWPLIRYKDEDLIQKDLNKRKNSFQKYSALETLDTENGNALQNLNIFRHLHYQKCHSAIVKHDG